MKIKRTINKKELILLDLIRVYILFYVQLINRHLPSSKTEADSIMKPSAVKHFIKTVAATMSAVFAFTLIPMALGQNAVVAAEAITKDQSNTSLCVSDIKEPKSGDETSAWTGSYVYFGIYGGNAIKFRVLAPSTNAYGGSTLFLDSDKTLFNKAFDDASNNWASNDCDLRTYLNGTFFNGSFMPLEKGAIAISKTDDNLSYNDSFLTYEYGLPASVNDRIFLLDASEVMNPDYGYSSDCGWDDEDNDGDWSTGYQAPHEVANHRKGGSYVFWWLRSARTGSDDRAGFVLGDGMLGSGSVGDDNRGVAPALNINQSSIIFSTKINDLGNGFGEYKLTLLDEKLKIAVQDGQQLAVSGTTVTVPYLISGDSAAYATRASILILDDKNENILFYDALSGTFSNSSAATGSFTFPDSLDPGEWGTGYHVYILAEEIHGTYETDYASKKVCIDDLAPTTFKVTYKVDGGTWSDDTTEDKTENVFPGTYPIRIPTEIKASSGYEGGSWNTDPSKATISADTTFTYSFKEIPKYTVTYKVVNGTWSDGTTGIKTETVMRDSSPTSIPDDMLASSGYEGGAWDIEPSSATITGATTFTYTFKAIPTYTVTVQNDGNGTATADVTSGPEGTEVTLTATPSSGYLFKEWQVISGGVTVTDNKFNIGTSDVTVKAVFEAIPTYTVTVQNDGNGTATADVTSGPEGTEVTLTATPSSGYLFKEWQVVSGGVTVTDNKFTIGTSDVTIKAVFEAKPATTFTVTFETNGGSAVASQTVTDGSKAAKPAEPTKDGSAFEGWYQDAKLESAFDFNTAITADVTLYAKWTTIASDPVYYTVVSGANGNAIQGSDYELQIKRSADDGKTYSDYFIGVKVDDKELVNGTDYTAAPGSVIITIKGSTLQNLNAGGHTVTVIFKDGTAITSINVKPAPTNSAVPSTGEAIGVSAIAGTVMILTACSMLVVMRTKKREDEL